MITVASSMVELHSRGGTDCPNLTQHGLAFIPRSIDAPASFILRRPDHSAAALRYPAPLTVRPLRPAVAFAAYGSP
jgi:hypothetical protein